MVDLRVNKTSYNVALVNIVVVFRHRKVLHSFFKYGLKAKTWKILSCIDPQSMNFTQIVKTKNHLKEKHAMFFLP